MKEPRERAARALCQRAGLPQNITFEGKPMWQSFLPEVDLVLKTIVADQLTYHLRQAEIHRKGEGHADETLSESVAAENFHKDEAERLTKLIES